jgi:hypothetical protein
VDIVSSDFEDGEKKLRVCSLLYEKCFESLLEFHLLAPKRWEFYLKLLGKGYIEV